MNERDVDFDWDEANIGHVARHAVQPHEAEEAILSDPVTSEWKSLKERSATSTWALLFAAEFFSW